MTNWLRQEDCTELFLTQQGIRVTHPLHRNFTDEQPQPTVEVSGPNFGVRHRLTLPALKLAVKLLDLMDWGITYEIYQGLIAQRKHILLNEAIMANRHDVAVRYRRDFRQFRASKVLWDSVKNFKAQSMDRRMMQGVALFAASWPETMWCLYDGESTEDFEGKHTAAPGEIAIRFWPVVFADAEHYNTRGVSVPVTFYIDEYGHVRHDYDGDDVQPHPHCFTDGTVCNGEARFGESQMQTLRELHNWWVGTDHSPAGGDDWSYKCYEWWQENMTRFFGWFEAQGTPAYYVMAPETSPHHNSTEEDRNAEAVTEVLTRAKLGELLATYSSTESRPDYECYSCGRGLDDGDAYYCDHCEEPFCRAHFNRDYDYCEACFEEHYTRCSDCGETLHVDDEVICVACGAQICSNCAEEDTNYDTYCSACKDKGYGEWGEDGVGITESPALPGQLALVPAAGAAKDGWVRDPHALGALTCHHESHGPWRRAEPRATWHYSLGSENIPPEDMAPLARRRAESGNAGTYVCDEHVPRVVPQALLPMPPEGLGALFNGLTQEDYEPQGRHETETKWMCQWPRGSTMDCKIPSTHTVKNGDLVPALCAGHLAMMPRRIVLPNFEEMESPEFWPEYENNLGARNTLAGTARRRWVGGNRGATGMIRGLNRLFSDNFRVAVFEAEYANKDFRETYDRLASYSGVAQEDYERETGLWYHCEYPVDQEGFFGSHECRGDAKWRAIDMGENSPAKGTGYWLCPMHYEALPRRRPEVAVEVPARFVDMSKEDFMPITYTDWVCQWEGSGWSVPHPGHPATYEHIANCTPALCDEHYALLPNHPAAVVQEV